MKKVVQITIEVDLEHQERKDWKLVRDYMESEIDDALHRLRNSDKLLRSHLGSTPSGATTYKYSVKYNK